MAGRILISLIVPTRGRPDQMLAFLDSVSATASRPETIEVIMVVDADDPASHSIDHETIKVIKVVVPPGATMGALNMAGYRASHGKYIMLMNDDVRVQTKEWDTKIIAIFRSFPDNIVLVHVNDKIFEDGLCTFPFVTREFCDFASGICDESYERYRIDDHIYHVFNLLALLGHKRIVYLPDIVFQHFNTIINAQGIAGYVPNPEIHARDSAIFMELDAARKDLAILLAAHIDAERRKLIDDTRRSVLSRHKQPEALRGPEMIRVMVDSKVPLNTRVTVGVVSANLENEHAKKCISLLKQHTQNFDLVVLDNNRGPRFNHAQEMNRILDICRTDFLVLMDDDVWVAPHWLENLLACITPTSALITPQHLDSAGRLAYAGIVMRPDDTGHHTHVLEAPKTPMPTQTICSAVMLIDMAKIGHLRIDECYSKYFLDIDYGLRVWEAGFEVIVAPDSPCTHLAGATLTQGGPLSVKLFEEQRQIWAQRWIETGRYARLNEGIWRRVPEFEELLAFPSVVAQLIDPKLHDSDASLKERAQALTELMRIMPALQQYFFEQLGEARTAAERSGSDEQLRRLGIISNALGPETQAEPRSPSASTLLSSVLPIAVQREIAKFLCTFGFQRAGAAIWNHAANRAAAAPARDMPRLLDSLPPSVELEIAKLLCTLGFVTAGAPIWNHAAGRAAAAPARDISGLLGSLPPPVELEIAKLLCTLGFVTAGAPIWNHAKSRTEKVGDENCISPLDSPCETAQAARRNLVSLKTVALVEKTDDVQFLDPDRNGFAVYRYEYLYFGIPLEQFRALGNKVSAEQCKSVSIAGMLVGSSLAEIDELISNSGRGSSDNGEVLVFTDRPLDQVEPLLKTIGIELSRCQFLVAGQVDPYNQSLHDCGMATIQEWAHAGGQLPPELSERSFTKAILFWFFPESWKSNAIEAVAVRTCKAVEIITGTGISRCYTGENLHRILYNKSYLSSMFESLPSPAGKSVLEIGCSDGLVCDIMSSCGAESVTGIDVMKTVGIGFRRDNIEYLLMDGSATSFPDESFDIVYSIATLEHVADPAKALLEILRVTRRGGHAYVQAGPLYHSPFGHHMFSYFKDYPWIHLLKSKEEILSLSKCKGIAANIERTLGIDAEEYIYNMLTFEHLNGQFLQEYGLQQFMQRPDVEVLKFNVSYEGRDLLTQDIVDALAPLTPAHLTEHGFELAFRRK